MAAYGDSSGPTVGQPFLQIRLGGACLSVDLQQVGRDQLPVGGLSLVGEILPTGLPNHDMYLSHKDSGSGNARSSVPHGIVEGDLFARRDRLAGHEVVGSCVVQPHAAVGLQE